MAISPKTRTVNGQLINLSGKVTMLAGGKTTVRVTAVAGATTYETVWSIQPNSGLSDTQLKADFEKFLDRAADEAAGRENTRQLAAQLT